MNREDFPILKNNLIYFDNGATTLKPQVMIDATVDYYKNYSANAHRGDYNISVKVDIKSLTSDTVIIEDITVDKPAITYEMLSLTQNNIKEIQNNVNSYLNKSSSNDKAETTSETDSADQSAGKKVIIKSLTINNGELQAAANVAGQNPDISVALPTIQMNNIGAAKNGDSIAQTITKIFNQILNTASATAVSSNLSNLKDVAKENLDNVVGGVKDRVKSIGIFGK